MNISCCCPDDFAGSIKSNQSLRQPTQRAQTACWANYTRKPQANVPANVCRVYFVDDDMGYFMGFMEGFTVERDFLK